MKQSNMFKNWMILIAICSLAFPTQVSCFAIPHSVTKIFTSPYGKAACFVICTYLAVRTIGYLVSDTTEDEEETSATDSKTKNTPQEDSWKTNPINLACITSVVGAITHVITHTTLSSWNEKTDATKFTSIEDKAKYCKPIDELIGSPQEVATKIYKSIISRHKDNRPPTNWLLHGPPGCGKTDLARAVARKLYEEIKADALFIKGSSFNTQYSGQGAEKVDALFKEAIRRTKNNTKPVIIIIDEIDALNSRDETDNGCGVSQSQTIDDLLSTLSDIKKEYKIYLIGTTNHKERVDKALQRRCAKPLEVQGLTREEMKTFIKQKSKGYPVDPSINISDLLNLFDDIPIASFIEELFEEASDNAETNNRKKITLKDFSIAAEGYQEHYDSHDKKQSEIETRDEVQRLNFIEQIKKSTGVSCTEAEDIFRKRTGYRGPRAYGAGGYASTGLLTKNEEWEEEQKSYTRNAEARAKEEYEYRRDTQRQREKDAEARAKEEYEYRRDTQRKREKEAEKRSKESLALQKLQYLKDRWEHKVSSGEFLEIHPSKTADCHYNTSLKEEGIQQRKNAGFGWIDIDSCYEKNGFTHKPSNK